MDIIYIKEILKINWFIFDKVIKAYIRDDWYLIKKVDWEYIISDEWYSFERYCRNAEEVIWYLAIKRIINRLI